jgi:hypothetical protein
VENRDLLDLFIDGSFTEYGSIRLVTYYKQYTKMKFQKIVKNMMQSL